MSETKARWHQGEHEGRYIYDENGKGVGNFYELSDANRCVTDHNALAGMEPEAVADVVAALTKAEAAMDDINGTTGTKSCPCCFCQAETYNGQVGIVHDGDCPVLEARNALASLDRAKEGAKA